MDITVWDWTLRRLDADGEALRRLKELSEKKIDGVAIGYMMANGIVGKVLDKISKSEAFDGGNPSRFIMGCVKTALLGLSNSNIV